MAYSTREAFDALQRAGTRDGKIGDYHVSHTLTEYGVCIRLVRTVGPLLHNEISRTVAWIQILAARPKFDVLKLTLDDMLGELRPGPPDLRVVEGSDAGG